MKTALLKVRSAAIFEIWLRNIRRFRLFRPVEHPLQIGCLPTVYLIRKIVDNMNGHQLRHGVKHWIHKPEPFSYTRHVHDTQQRTTHTTYTTHTRHTTHTPRTSHTRHIQCDFWSNFDPLEEAKCLVI